MADQFLCMLGLKKAVQWAVLLVVSLVDRWERLMAAQLAEMTELSMADL
eukprot:CAMPEP_0182438970 /NCGR_PEP_ID=MMETSP1167-20130531/86140_1 /TAXON_ID=2988 /ORGANISM="Mallomonas Sp, Strain CCMP3275" /LENGTH=48 /DNA_ID= /DNA_START= /DNA_END= /DNA_ORIENTATION=